ncbi:MAG: threonylcarbamoyl-AMP synthase [Proteobacteria bacterium]|nr:threonylcarbamoyl-AMP synthase [Pseudomonadota bacterium]
MINPASNLFAPSTENIAAAAAVIGEGGLIAFPTETVYGLGADAANDRAVASIFEAKDRPRFNPLIVHFANSGEASDAAAFDARAHDLAGAFWPGALTLVLERRPASAISLLVSAGLETLAVRVPAHPVAQALLAAAKRPIAAPSANRAGEVSPTSADHVSASLAGSPRMILDGGRCPVGIESTVLDLTTPSPVILRPGGITRDEIEAVIGPTGLADAALADATEGVKSPGMLARHYAPGRPLRLDAGEVGRTEALLAFGRHAITGGAVEMNLSPSADLTEAAANLFAMLRALDRPDISAIAVMPIPETGLGVAINDRLRRATQSALAGPAAKG